MSVAKRDAHAGGEGGAGPGRPSAAFREAAPMLESTMMDSPLTVPSILERAKSFFADREIVSVVPVGFDPETRAPVPGTHRTTYGRIHGRVARLANALADAGIRSGHRVATMALNHYRHLEAYFAVPATGAVLHTVNFRLHPDQIAYVLGHAEDRVLLVDNVFAPMLDGLLPRVPSIEKVVVMGPVPGGPPEGSLDYEEFIEEHPEDFAYPELDERQAAGLCYTSGTTGNPKGVLYSHRSTVLHALAQTSADSTAVSERDTNLAVVPMFHVNAWGMPYSGALAGSKQVFVSMFVDPRSLATVVQDERVTLGAGVPTIWMGLLDELDRAREEGRPYDTSSVRTLFSGGAPAPRAMIAGFDTRHGIRVTNAWGMTETSPVGAVNNPKPEHDALRPAQRHDQMAKSGRPPPLVEIEIVGDDGEPLPHDGETMGHLLVRGPWVAKGYYKGADHSTTGPRGWFETGDIATIDRDGYMLIQDRAKDLVEYE